MGLRARTAQSAAGDQLPLGGPPIPDRTLSGSGVALLRVHRNQVAEIQMAVYQAGRGLVLLCRTLATGEQRYARGLHDPDHRARSGRCAHPQSTSRGAGASGLDGLAGSHAAGSGAPSSFADGELAGRAGALTELRNRREGMLGVALRAGLVGCARTGYAVSPLSGSIPDVGGARERPAPGGAARDGLITKGETEDDSSDRDPRPRPGWRSRQELGLV